MVWLCTLYTNPATYQHTHLPNGKDLLGDALKKALTDILDEYSTDTVVNKLMPCANIYINKMKVLTAP